MSTCIHPLTAPRMRIFEHGATDCLSMCPLFSGCEPCMFEPSNEAQSYSERGLMLTYVEFILRNRATKVCILTRAPSFLQGLASLFKDVRFIVFSCTDQGDYDPEQASTESYVESNVCAFNNVFTKDMARVMGCLQPPRQSILICSPLDHPLDQMLFHVLCAPARSLLSVSSVPEDFLYGELVYPIYVMPGSTMVHIDAPGRACHRIYFPYHLRDELAFHNTFTRCGGMYDQDVEEMIVRAYASGEVDCDAAAASIRGCLPSVAQT